jgi:gluconokinase
MEERFTKAVISPKGADPPLILSIDVGSSSVRVMLFDRLGRLVAGSLARRKYQTFTKPDGTVETNPETLLNHIWSCVDQLLASSGNLSEHFAGVAICTFVTNILGANAQGTPVTTLISYADTRASKEAILLREGLDEVEVHNRTGCRFHTSYLPARMLWFKRARPVAFHQASRWMSIGELMAFRLFGETAVSYSTASWTGLLDRNRLAWDQALMDFLPVSMVGFSPLVDLDVPWRGLVPKFAERWPALSDLPWFPAIGDGAGANIGSGCVDSGRLALSMGTSSALRITLTEPVDKVPEGLWCYRVDKDRSLVGGALSEGGNIFAWLNHTLDIGKIKDWEAELANMSPDGHGLTVLPFFSGERSPGWRADLRGVIEGLSLSTTSLDLVRAGLESVAYRIGMIHEIMKEEVPSSPWVIGNGAALLNSPTWVQIISDVLGVPVSISQVEEASARGAALLALRSLGHLEDVESAPDFTGEQIAPDLGRHEVYLDAMARQQALYSKFA